MQAALTRGHASEHSGAASMDMCSSLLRGQSGLCRGMLVVNLPVHQGADRLSWAYHACIAGDLDANGKQHVVSLLPQPATRTRREGRALQPCCSVHLLERVSTQSSLLTAGVLQNTWSLSMLGAIVYLALAAGCWCAASLFLLDSKEDTALNATQRQVGPAFGAWLGLTMLWADSTATAPADKSRSICS